MGMNYYTPIEVFANGILFECGCRIIGGKERIMPNCHRTWMHPTYPNALIETATRTYNRCHMEKILPPPTAILTWKDTWEH